MGVLACALLWPALSRAAPAKTGTMVAVTPPPTPAVVESAAKTPPPATVAPVPVKSPPTRFGIALRIGLLVPSGRYSDVSLGTSDGLTSSGAFDHRGATFASALQLTYQLPVLENAIGVGVEAGISPLSGEGSRSMPNDPDFGTLSYRWKSLAVPLVLGVNYRLPLEKALPWWPKLLRIRPEVGFAVVHSSFTTTYSNVEEPSQSGWALGYLLGVEAAFGLGPGEVVANVRFMSARTDLGFQKTYSNPQQPWNQHLGDVQGTNVLAGYRLTL